MQIGYNLRIQVCSNPLTILVRVLLGSHILLNYTSQIFNILCNQNSMRTDLISYSAFLRDLHSEYPWKWFISKNVDTEIRTSINRIVFTTVLLLRRTPVSSSCWYYLEAPVYHSLSHIHIKNHSNQIVSWYIRAIILLPQARLTRVPHNIISNIQHPVRSGFLQLAYALKKWISSKMVYIQNILHFTNEVLKSFVISLSCGWH